MFGHGYNLCFAINARKHVSGSGSQRKSTIPPCAISLSAIACRRMDHRAVIEELGGYQTVAKRLGCHPARPALIDLARQCGVPLTFEALLATRPAEPAVALLTPSSCSA
jgi:hypothetical protein